MATGSRWCRSCGAENRPNATVCRSCGKSLFAAKKALNGIDGKKEKLHHRRMRPLKPTKTKIGIVCILLLFLFILILVTNPGLTPAGAVLFVILFPLLLPSHISDALQGNVSFQTNFTPFFFLLLLADLILLYIIISLLYFLIKKIRSSAQK